MSIRLYVHLYVRPKIISVTHFSATANGIDLKFDMHLWHHELYCVCDFHWCWMPTSCLSYFVRTYVHPEIISVTHFSATADGNDLKFGMQLWHHELYHWCRMSTSCLSDFTFGGGICVRWTHSLLSFTLECNSLVLRGDGKRNPYI